MIKCIFGMQVNMEVFHKSILSIWVCVTKHVQNKKFAYLCNISRKAWGEVDFLPANKHENFLQGDSITLGVRSQACPTQYPKQVCNILEYLKENVKDEVDFLPADKRQRFLQIDTVILDECAQACQNYLK